MIVLGLSVWLLWSPPEKGTKASDPAAIVNATPKVKAHYTIKIAPGSSYLPDVAPYGMGKPLQGIKQVIAAFEQKFPDTRIEVLSVPATREFLVTQLSSGLAPDIINVNVEDVWIDAQKGWYLPFDSFFEQPNPFIPAGQPGSVKWWDQFKYQAITRGKAAPDGNLYCLSYDMVETGIFYNKNIFKKVGVEPPRDWDDFIRILKKIKETPINGQTITPIILFSTTSSSFLGDWCQDLFFDQLYHNIRDGLDLLSDPRRADYMPVYLDWDEICFLHKQGFFTRRDKRYVELWKQMKAFRQYAGKDMTADVVREFIQQKGAMIWNSSNFTYRLAADPELGFDWGVFYLPSFTKQTTKYASETPMCVIGGSSTQFELTNSCIRDTDPKRPLAERMAQSEQLKRVIAFLQFLCIPEQYEKIVNEYACYLPNIVGVPVLDPVKPFDEILKRPYTTTKWLYTFDLKYDEIQLRMLDLYLNDGISLDGYLDWMERNMDEAIQNAEWRKKSDYDKMRKVWREKAPLRAKMEDLPSAN